MKIQKQYVAPSFSVSEKTLFSAKTCLVDRFRPGVEEIRLPAFETQGGEITLSYDGTVSVSRAPQGPASRRFMGRLKNKFRAEAVEDRILVDYRRNSPGNWSHCLNSHIPFAFFLTRELSPLFEKNKPLFVLSQNAPSYTKKIFDYFGIDYINTDNDVEGQFVQYTQRPFHCLRGWSYLWIREMISAQEPYKALIANKESIPKKIFFSRRKTRALSNENEVQSYLAGKGYTCIYSEDHSVADQLRMCIHATDIVAIHGAAMGPLVYRPLAASSLNLLEIFTPGHMTDFHRGTADQIGASWVGVRGRIEAKHTKHAYNFSEKYVKHSLDSFYVDIESLDRGLALLSEKTVRETS